MENHVVLLVGNGSALELENVTNMVHLETTPESVVVKYIPEDCALPQELNATQQDSEHVSTNSNKVSKAIQADECEDRPPGRFPSRNVSWPMKFKEFAFLDADDSDEDYTPQKDSRNDKLKVKRKPGRPPKDSSSVKNADEQNTSETTAYSKKNYKKRKSSRNQNFKCEICSKIFSQRGNLTVHLRVHTDERPFSCSVCKKKFKSKEAMLRHQNTHTGEKPFPCSVCGQGFSSALALKEHQARHTDDYLYECSICQRGFRQISCIKRHLLIHSNETPFVCTVCGRKFSQKVYLRSHMRTHTGERPYQCTICNKSFAHLSDLTRHKIIHTGQKPYTCKQCGASFSDPSSQRRHEREHSKTKPFCCELCDESFKRMAQLKQHMSKQHSEVQLILSNCIQMEITEDQPQLPIQQILQMDSDPTTIILDADIPVDQQETNDLLDKGSVEEPLLEEPSDHNYVQNPDFGSQDYYNWLSSFTTLCKQLSIPIKNELFKNISQVQKSIADVLSSPTGILSNKDNFQILMSISKDLNEIINTHLSYIFNTLDGQK